MTEPIILKKLVCDDPEAYSTMFGGWFHRMTQLSAGRFGYRGWSIDLPGLRIYLDQHSRSIRWSEYCHIPITAFFIPVCSDGPVRWSGRELHDGNAVIQGQNFEHHLTTGSASSFIYLDIDQSLVRERRWHLPENRKIVLSPQGRSRLIEYCLRLPSVIGPGDLDGNTYSLRDDILRLLERALFAPGSDLHAPHRRADLTDFEIFRRAERLLDGDTLRKPLAVDDLVQKTGVSKRSLYRAFDRQVGVSPARYIEIVRLKNLRRYLKSQREAVESIAEIAKRFGYSNPGRMARRYAEMFHEYPKETIARSKYVGARSNL